MAGLSRDELDKMFVDQWSRRKRSMPILPGINGGYGSFVGQPSYSSYGKRNDDIDDILGQGFIGKWIHFFNILTFRFLFYLIKTLTLYVTYSLWFSFLEIFGFFGHGQMVNKVIVMLFDSDSPLISGQLESFSAQ